MNLLPKRVAGVKYEVLILSVVLDSFGAKLLFVDEPVELGGAIV